MNILALDLGTTTGWALRVDTGLRQDGKATIVSGTHSFKPGRYEGGGMRYLRFRRWLEEFLPRPEVVYFEEVRGHKGCDAAHIYGGLLGHLTVWCEERGIPYQGIPVGSIKRAATGKGNCGKDEVIDAVRRAGHKPCDDNEADALALLLWGIEST